MTIEFRCTSCDKLLRTPDGTEGKQAKCPQCGAVMQVPARSAYDAPPREPDFSAPMPETMGYPHEASQQPANPYRAPLSGAAAPGDAAAMTVRGFNPTRVSFSEVFDQTWNIYKSNLLMCVVGGLIANVGANALQLVIQKLFERLIENSAGGVTAVAGIFYGIATLGVTTFFVLGMFKYFVGIARSGEARIGDLFSAGPLLVSGSLLFFLLAIGAGVGLLLLIVPGVLFLLFFAQSPFLLLDQQMGVMDSLRYSAAAMSGNKMTVFLLYSVTYLAGIAFTVLTCFVGGLFVAPFIALLYAVTYLRVTGQSTSAVSAYRAAAQQPYFPPGSQPQA